jgi:hypothetical protein
MVSGAKNRTPPPTTTTLIFSASTMFFYILKSGENILFSINHGQFNQYSQKRPSLRGKITQIVLLRSNVYPVYEELQNFHLKKKKTVQRKH